MSRPSNRSTRQRQIVEAAVEVIGRRGYERATISAIAEAADLTPGLLHYHFGSKREILVAVVESLGEVLEARYEQLGERCADGDPWARLDAFLDAHLAVGEGADRGAVACWVSVGVEAVHLDEVREVYAEVVGRQLATLEGLLVDVLDAEGRATEGVETVAATLYAAIEGIYQLDAAAPGATPGRGYAAPALRDAARALVARRPLVGSREGGGEESP